MIKNKVNILLLLLYLFVSAPAATESLRDILQEQEAEHQSEIRKISKELGGPSSGQDYGGELGNKYFELYQNKVILPALSRYLAVYYKTTKDLEKEDNRGSFHAQDRFADILNDLADYRYKIARETKTPRAELFNQRASALSERLGESSIWEPWRKFLRKKYSVTSLDYSKPQKCADALMALGTRITDSYESKLAPDIEFAAPRERALDSPIETLPRLIISRPTVEGIYPNGIIVMIACSSEKDVSGARDFIFEIDHEPKDQVPGKRFARQFLDALAPNLSSQELHKRIGEILYRYNQASIRRRGQAAIGEWLAKGMANSQNFELCFTGPEWKGSKNNSMGPDMHALSYLYQDDFVAQFLKNSVLKEKGQACP